MTLQAYQFMPKGRPQKLGGPTDIDRERGRRVGEWLRSGMSPPHQIVDLSNRSVARLTGLSPSMIGYYANDCYDASEDRMKFPSEEAISLIASKLRISSKEGMAARFWKPQQPTPVIQIPNLSVLKKAEGYSELDDEQRQIAEAEFEEAQLDAAAMAIARAQRRTRKRQSIGGIGEE